MESEENFSDIVLREKERSLFISRVPTPTKERFMELANSEFASDYGMTLVWCLNQAIEYQSMKSVFFENINNKLDQIITLSLNKTEEKPESKEIKLLDGRKVRVKGGKNGKAK